MSAQNPLTRPQDAKAERLQSRRATAPAVDIFENEHEVLLVADLPGVAPDQVNIQLERGELTLEGRRPGAPTGSLLAAESGLFDTLRTFRVSNAIDAGRIAAELKQGVLTIHLPKVETAKPRRVAVTGG